MEFTVSQIAQLIGGKVEGNGEEPIRMLAKIQEAKKGEISFLSNPKYEPHIYETKASAVIVNKGFIPKKKVSTTLISVDDPYSSFTVLLEEYHKFISYQKTGIEQPSFLGENSTVGEEVYRGAFSYIGHNAKIGKNVKIYPHAYVGDYVEIGDNTIINAGVKLYPHTKVGHNCVIHSGCVIGSDGFGFARDHKGSYEKVEQLGGVIISSQVEIGANTTIDRGTLSNTHIGFGVKIDSQVQIAHNVKIGEHTVIAGCVGIAGSAEIGSHCMIGGASGVAGHVKIASGVILTGMAMATKSIKKAGIYSSGTGILENSKWRKNAVYFRNMESLQKRLEKLEQALLKK